MAEILIKGIEIPKKGNVGILIYADGSAEVCGTGSWSKPVYGTPTTKVIEVPPHGDLWDKDKVFKVFDERMEMYRELGYKDDDISIQELGHIQADLIAKVETVIEAST